MRTRAPRPVTFICSWCYREATEDRAPGSTSVYYLSCTDEAPRAANATRVQAYRERIRLPRTGRERRPDRPRKGLTGR